MIQEPLHSLVAVTGGSATLAGSTVIACSDLFSSMFLTSRDFIDNAANWQHFFGWGR
jgi:hypothetical protein